MNSEETSAGGSVGDGVDAKAKPPRAGRDLPAALAVGIGLFALVIFCMVQFPLGVAILLAVLAVLGCVEMHQALALRGAHSAIIPIAAFTGFIVVSGYFPALGYLPWALTAGAMFTAMLWRMPKGVEGYTRDISASALIIGYVPLLASFVGPVLAMPNGSAKLAAVFLCVCGSDTGG
ncbi:MAG: hypothetical protein LBI99_10235, partial [Propionibacteriaceae bacterium]|nr:hypothetical protein [Propionibacteriaceae bacterium]